MKHLLASIFILALCATGFAQTIRTLGYNSSNGVVVTATNVTWTNSFGFSTNTVAAQVRTNLGLGWSALTNTSAATGLIGYTLSGGDAYITYNANSLYITNDLGVNTIGCPYYSVSEGGQIVFEDGAASANTRANLGFSTNLVSVWTATNATNFQAAVFSATNTAPTNATNVAGWINVSVGSGTNVYKLPVYK